MVAWLLDVLENDLSSARSLGGLGTRHCLSFRLCILGFLALRWRI